jgi:hypothetical protein
VYDKAFGSLSVQAHDSTLSTETFVQRSQNRAFQLYSGKLDKKSRFNIGKLMQIKNLP